MTSVTRAPTGQDLVCLVCHKQAQDIDHVVNRGMGGSKQRDVPENKVPLCRECHQAKTNNVLETYVAVDLELDDTGQLNYFWRRRGSNGPWIAVPVEVSQRYGCLVGRLSDGAEGGELGVKGNSPSPARSQDRALASAPSLKEESDGRVSEESQERNRILGRDAYLPNDSSRHNRASSADSLSSDAGSSPSPRTLTHEQRVAITKEIRDAEWGRQWIAGDTGNAWIAELGEEAEQYLSDFGYVHESLANILRVCAAIPAPYRNGNLRYSHHVVVYELPREDQVLRLKECEDEGWSVAEFRRQVKGTKPKVKRWSVPELQAKWDEWPALNRHIEAFLDWLGGEG